MNSIYNNVFDALSVGAMIIRREKADQFRLADINPSGLAAVGLEELDTASVEGKLLSEVFDQVAETGLYEQFNYCLDANSAVHVDAFRYEDSRVRMGLYDFDLVALSSDTILITYKNNTEEYDVKEALSDSEARFQAMTECSPEYIMLIDREAHILYLNRTVSELTMEEVIGTKLFNYVPSSYHDIMEGCFRSVWDTRIANSYEAVYEYEDGSIMYFETTVGPVYKSGEVVALVTSSRDISRFRDTEAKMNDLAIELLETQESERRHIAQELHDEVGGLLASIQINLTLIPDEQKNSVPQLSKLTTMMDSLIEQVRSLTLDLRPELLDTSGLELAVSQLTERYSNRNAINVSFACALPRGARFAPEIETAAYRLIQEALTNIARHAHVDFATVSISLDAGAMSVQIVDEGIGFNMDEQNGPVESLGLSGMHQRASLLGGRVDISSSESGGTTILGHFPLSKPVAERLKNATRTS